MKHISLENLGIINTTAFYRNLTPPNSLLSLFLFSFFFFIVVIICYIYKFLLFLLLSILNIC